MVDTIQATCKKFRSEILRVTVPEMCEKLEVKTSTMYAFENGYSSNLNHLFNYVKCCESKTQLREFHKAINAILNKDSMNV